MAGRSNNKPRAIVSFKPHLLSYRCYWKLARRVTCRVGTRIGVFFQLRPSCWKLGS